MKRVILGYVVGRTHDGAEWLYHKRGLCALWGKTASPTIYETKEKADKLAQGIEGAWVRAYWLERFGG